MQVKNAILEPILQREAVSFHTEIYWLYKVELKVTQCLLATFKKLQANLKREILYHLDYTNKP